MNDTLSVAGLNLVPSVPTSSPGDTGGRFLEQPMSTDRVLTELAAVDVGRS